MLNKFTYTFSLKILSMIIGFFISVIIIKKLPVEEYGIFSLLNSIIMISVMVFTFNIQELLFIKLSKVKSKLILSQIISTTNTAIFVIYTFFIIVVLFTPMNTFLLHIFNLEDYSKAFNFTVYYIFIYSLILTFMRYFMFTSQSVKYSVSELIIATLWIVPFLFYGSINVFDIMKYKFFTVFLIILGMFYIFYKQNESIGIFKNFNISYLKEAFVFGMATFLPSICIYVLTVINVFLLSYLDTNESVALFSFANLPFTILNGILSSTLILILLPKINHYHKDRNSRKYVLMSKIFKLVLVLLIPISLYIIVFSSEIILLLSKKEYLVVSDLFWYLSLVLILTTLVAFLKQELYLEKRYKELIIVFLPAVFINIVLNFYLIPEYSYKGAAIALLATYIYILFSLIIITKIYKYLYIKLKDIILIILSNIIVALVLAMIIFTKDIFILDDSIFQNILLLVSSAIILFLPYLYYFNKRNLFNGVLK